jgi:hypothetical protein
VTNVLLLFVLQNRTKPSVTNFVTQRFTTTVVQSIDQRPINRIRLINKLTQLLTLMSLSKHQNGASTDAVLTQHPTQQAPTSIT